MTENAKKVLDRVAGNYNKMGAALLNARIALGQLEARVGLDVEHDEATEAIARSAIRSIDDCMESLEAL